MAWGAAAGVLPDLDLVGLASADPLAEFRHHRTLTHALWFGPALGPLLGAAVARFYRRRDGAGGPEQLQAWVGLFVVALFTHPLLDLFTSYGTQLLWPHPRRFALDAVAIIDPFYSLPLAGALALALWVRQPARRARLAIASLLVGTVYLFYTLWLNQRAEDEVRRQIAAGVQAQVSCYPTLFQPWLRRVVVRDGERISVGAISLWRPHVVRWQHHREPRDARIDAARATDHGRLFEWFAMGQTAARVTPAGDAVEIDDLRYGYFEHPGHGLWGVRLALDAEGRPRGAAQRYNRRPQDRSSLVRRLWQATFFPG